MTVVYGAGYLLRSTIDRDTGIFIEDEPADCRHDRIWWIEPNGRRWEWPMGQPAGVEGRGIPPIVLDEQPLLGDGVSQGSPTFGAREIVIPFKMLGLPEDIRREIRQWGKALAADRRQGTLLVQSLVNDERQIACRYSGGFTLVENLNVYVTQAVVFRAAQPFWEDAAETVLSWSPVTENTNFFPISNPDTGSFITISQGNVITTATIENNGDMPAWPIWEITGPGSGLVQLVNADTGETIQFSRSLALGETITIDTRPGIKTVRAADGSNEFRSLGLSQLFALAPGATTVYLSVGGAETETTIKLRFRRQWLTA
jgi:hypothetical protein